MNITPTTVAEVKAAFFTTELSKTYTDREGKEHVRTYPAVKIHDDLFIVIERDNSNAHADDPYYGTNIDLHVMNADVSWAGGGCTVYGPEITFSFEVKHAYVNVSTCSEKSLERTRAHAQMIDIACQLAEAWTAQDLPKLEAAAAEEKAKNDAHREELRKQREADRAAAKALADKVDGKQLRITIRNKKVPFVGYISQLDGTRFFINVHWKDEDQIISFDDIEKIETKNDRGRFETAYVVEEA